MLLRMCIFCCTFVSLFVNNMKKQLFILLTLLLIGGSRCLQAATIIIPEQAQEWNIPADAIDVMQAREICSSLSNNQSTTSKYYVMGYVQKLDAKHTTNVTQYGNATFYIEQEKGSGSTNNFYAYRVKGLNNANLTDANSIKVGDFVILYGNLTNYKGVYETQANKAYIWRSTNPLLGGGDNGDDGDEPVEIPTGDTQMQDGLLTIGNPAYWTYNELQSYIGQEVEFANHFYVTKNTKSGQLTIAPRLIFTPTNQALPLSSEYQLLLDLNPQAQVTLTNVQGYHRIGERLHNLRVKVNAANSLQLLSCDWRGNTREDMEKGYDSVAVDMRGKHSMLLCYMNLEYYLVENFGTGYGPDNENAHSRQRTKVSQALAKINADVYAFVEIQTGQGALAELAADLSKNTGRNFTYIDDGSATDGSYTKSGYIYCTDLLTPYSSMVHNNTYVQNRKKVQGFVENATGEKFLLSVNHFKAKSGSGSGTNADQGDGQGSYNAARVKEANSIVTNLSSYQSQFDDEDMLIVGDLNAYAKEDPIRTFLDAGMIDLHRAFHADSSYSYVYNGQLGYLDHAICNASMYEQVTGMVAYHINSVEKDSYTYDGSSSDLTMFRCSDHDPLLIGLSLGGIRNEDTPDTPEDPDTPDTPEDPDTPDTPDTPDNPDTPEDPDTPDTPDTPNDDQPTDVMNNVTSPVYSKLFRNGQIIIIRNGKEYDILGNVK